MMGLWSWFFGANADRKIHNPAAVFETPADVVDDPQLSTSEKKEALNHWEQDARQLMTASNEGMTGRNEGIDPGDHHQMGQVVRAKEKIGEGPNHKPAH
jgi:hypothetical protein